MATVPSEITWVSGQVVTAAQLNTNLRDAINFLINPPILQARQTTVQSIPNGGAVLLFDTEDVDNDNMHSTVTNTSRATAVTAGRYMFAGGPDFSANASGRKGSWWVINGTALNGTTSIGPSSGANNTAPPAKVIYPFLNVGNYIELFAYQESGGAVNTGVATIDQSSLNARWLGTT